MSVYLVDGQQSGAEYGMVQMECFIPTDSEECDLPRMLHVHQDRLEVVYIREGAAMYNIGGKVYPTKAGDVLVLHPGVIHGREPAQGMIQSNYCCAIRNLHLEGLPENHLLSDQIAPVLHCGDRADHIRQIMGLLLWESSSNGVYSGSNVHHLLHLLLNILREVACRQEYSAEDEELALVARIKTYIDRNFMHNPSLSDMANSLNISLFYMSHFFKEKTGYAPQQYLTIRQMGEAQTLLIHTDLTVQEIGEQVGFLNPEHFNKAFKKLIGLPPGQFRKANRTEAGKKLTE